MSSALSTGRSDGRGMAVFTAQDLRAKALALLARREHSRTDLARKLARWVSRLGLERDAAKATLEALLDDLAARGWLSDARFADSMVRRLASKYGARRIELALRQDGISAESARTATTYLGTTEHARALAILRRKYPRPPDNYGARLRQMRFLQGRGFDLDLILRVLQTELNTEEQE